MIADWIRRTADVAADFTYPDGVSRTISLGYETESVQVRLEYRSRWAFLTFDADHSPEKVAHVLGVASMRIIVQDVLDTSNMGRDS